MDLPYVMTFFELIAWLSVARPAISTWRQKS